MDFQKYQQEASGTFKPGEIVPEDHARLANWALGIAGEGGELCNMIKHVIFHREKINKMEIAKELGDQLWYIAAMCTSLNIDMSDCAELNLTKLSHRHGKSFSFQGSLNRKELETKLEDTDAYKQIQERIEREIHDE
jgi:NTP pyrophosphatase (non-canonical NTP hydrolase)